MHVIRHTEHFRISKPTILTIGTFDGVHQGHQAILFRLAQLKKTHGLQTAVLTFEPHPRKVLFPEQKDLRLLTTVDEKLVLLEEHGVDITVVYPFSKAFSQMDAKEYVEYILVKSLNVQYLVIGYDHKFGKHRSGDINVLRKYESENHFVVEEISARDIDNIAVSSTKIRKALEEGQLALAADFMGHSYSISGKVVRGKQLGRTLGYPTANIRPESADKLIPAKGIYFVETKINGRTLYGMMSIGINPTTDNDEQLKLEVNIFDFNEDIYGKDIEIRFLKRLRDEKKFDGLDELVAALEKDRQMCESLIAEFQ